MREKRSPAVLTLIGILDLAKHTVHPGGTNTAQPFTTVGEPA
jgi:hypothetical protein